jgi:predicted permease
LILIALIVVASTALGVGADRSVGWAGRVSRLSLTLMLYGLIPFVAFVNFAHLKLTVGAAVGLAVAWVGLGLAGYLAFLAGRSLGLPRRSLGALVIAVMIVNTGFLGYPVSVALLGHGALPHAVVYDQVVSTPLLFTVGFALGGRFGDSERAAQRREAGGARALLLNPPLWGAAIGLVGGPALAPHLLVTIGNDVVDAFIVLGFFAVGVALSSERRADGASLFQPPDRPVLIALALRFSVNSALLALVSATGTGIPNAYLLQAAMPTAINGLIIAHGYGLDQRLMATAIVWSTLAVLIVATLASLA